MLVELSNTPRDYAWGSPTLIADLQQRPATGSPEAEVWFGDHPGSPATLVDGTGRTLDEWFAGSAAATGSPARLPFLVKVLAAASALSIQVHPSRDQARDGFAREDAAGIARAAPHRNYKDGNHKPEVIVALAQRFEALAGLRPLEHTRRLLAELGGGAGVTALRDVLAGEDDAHALRTALAWVLSDEAQHHVDEIIGAASAAQSDEFAAELNAIRRIAANYPGDPGVVVALLMNHVVLEPGEAIFLPAGMLHAYLSGLGVEVMAASDNVLRGGLTPKHIDVAELLEIVDARPVSAPRLVARAAGPGREILAPGIPDFELERIRVSAETENTVELRGPAIVVVTSGEVEVAGRAGRVQLSPGRAAFASPDEGAILLTGRGEAIVTMPGTYTGR